MSIGFLSRHVTKANDTLESLVSEYRLSSWRAIADIAANKTCRPQLLIRGELPIGLMISIPPNANDLVKERLYLLHRLRPSFLAHFDALALQVEQQLRPLLLGTKEPQDSADIAAVLATMQGEVNKAVEELGRHAWPLVSICVGMSHTHVSERVDHLAAGTVGDPLCGLYWAISPPVLNLWQQLCARETWQDRWRDCDADTACQRVYQYHNTVRSLVVQKIDQQIRKAQKLELDLRQEGYQ